MDFVWRVRLATVGVILLVLVVSSPALGVVDLTPPASDPNEVGGGTANVSMVSAPAAETILDEGRFGTDVYYLRPPPAVVDIASVDGRPRITYKIEVPELEYSNSESRVLSSGQTGRLRLSVRDRAFAREQIGAGRAYRVEILVRVQSFDMDEVIYRENTTVGVAE